MESTWQIAQLSKWNAKQAGWAGENKWNGKHWDPPNEVIYPPNLLCRWVDNGMQLNLLLIRVLMCVIKYIAMSQLENTGAIHHFNWYPPQATWAHNVPSVFPEWSLLAERRCESKAILLERTHWLYGVCVCVRLYFPRVYIRICAFCAVLCELWDVWEHRLLIMRHASPMVPMLSVCWMVTCQRMQMQSTIVESSRASMDVFDSDLISEAELYQNPDTGNHEMFNVILKEWPRELQRWNVTEYIYRTVHRYVYGFGTLLLRYISRVNIVLFTASTFVVHLTVVTSSLTWDRLIKYCCCQVTIMTKGPPIREKRILQSFPALLNT